jgi:Gas vesicle synthesis protein GvpL/GvpF
VGTHVDAASAGSGARPSLTYVYCVVHAARAPSVARAPAGPAGLGRARVLGAGDDLWLVVADAPPAAYGAAAIEAGLRELDWISARGLAHDAVVAHFARAGTVLPLRLLTLFTDDARAGASVAGRRQALLRLAARVAGRREWGLLVRLAPRRTPAEPDGAPGRSRASGTAYLRRKRAERGRTARGGEARREADAAFRALRRFADDARRQAVTEGAPGSRVVLDAAFLVATSRTGRFRAAVRRWAERLRGRGCDIRLTGPWPVYTFVGDAAAQEGR